MGPAESPRLSSEWSGLCLVCVRSAMPFANARPLARYLPPRGARWTLDVSKDEPPDVAQDTVQISDEAGAFSAIHHPVVVGKR